MVIFYKCSFRASHGFRIGKYDTGTGQLSYVSEKSSELRKAIPDAVEYTLSNQLGRCLLLAADENGNCFLGVYGLVEGNDDKYVNAVFYDGENPRHIIALYEYFCSNQKSASVRLLESVQRTSREEYRESLLEFTIRTQIITELLHDALSSCPDKGPAGNTASNAVFAFITADKYDNHQVVIEDKFTVNRMYLCEEYNTDTETVPNYPLAIKNVRAAFPISLLFVIGGTAVVLALILISFFFP